MDIQIIVTVFILFALFRIVQNYRSKRLSMMVSFFWIAVWVAVAVVFWAPESASRLAMIFGIGRGADLIVYSAVIVLVYLVYRLFVRMENLERTITTLTRALSIDEAKKRNHDDTRTDR